MSARVRRFVHDRDGYALLTVMIFVFVITLVGLAFFSVASYETKGALYRQKSSEAFYLADGAIERARAKFLADRSWRAGWSGVASGRGTYDLAVRDTTFGAYPNAVQLLAAGHVQNSTRRIEVMADVPPTSLDLPVLVMGDADIKGNLCLGGEVHVNGDPGSSGSHLACGGTMSSGFPIYPPPIYTDSGHFPNATYYYVKGISNVAAVVTDGNGIDVTATVGNLSDVISYNNGTKTFTFSFTTAAKISKYFDNVATGFKKNPGDIGVVVNFGEQPLLPSSRYQAVIIDGGGASNIHSTIINSRFVGATEAQRLDWNFWDGDDNKVVEIKQIKFEPYLGIAIIAQNLQRTGSSHAYLGSATWPALVYITRDVITINANLEITGSLICLRDFHSTGGPDITYNASFIPNLPGYLSNGWPAGVSGTLKVLRWREIASAG